jgi:hypothetical protein
MAELSIVAGATSQTINVFIKDSTVTTGAGLTGLVYNSAGLAAYYAFPRQAPVAITLATLAGATAAYASGGFYELDSTHMSGLYRLDLPDGMLASGQGRFVTLYLYGATNMMPLVLTIELTGWDNQDGVHGGLTALPNAAAAANGGLLTAGAGSNQLHVDSSGRVDLGLVLGTAVTAATAGILDVNAKNIAGVAATADSNNNLKVDVEDWHATAVSSPATAGIPDVNVKNYNNQTAQTDASNYPKVDVEHWVAVAPNALVSGRVDAITNALGSDLFTIKKNTALSNFSFVMFQSSDHVTPMTGLTVTAQRSIDGGAFASCANAPTELGNGVYLINLAASDLNGNVITLRFTGTSADATLMQIITQA